MLPEFLEFCIVGPDPADDVADLLADAHSRRLHFQGEPFIPVDRRFALLKLVGIRRIDSSYHLLDRETPVELILPSSSISLLCGKSAYVSFVFFDEQSNAIFRSSHFFQFVGYKQSSPAPSHARNHPCRTPH